MQVLEAQQRQAREKYCILPTGQPYTYDKVRSQGLKGIVLKGHQYVYDSAEPTELCYFTPQHYDLCLPHRAVTCVTLPHNTMTCFYPTKL